MDIVYKSTKFRCASLTQSGDNRIRIGRVRTLTISAISEDFDFVSSQNDAKYDVDTSPSHYVLMFASSRR